MTQINQKDLWEKFSVAFDRQIESESYDFINGALDIDETRKLIAQFEEPYKGQVLGIIVNSLYSGFKVGAWFGVRNALSEASSIMSKPKELNK